MAFETTAVRLWKRLTAAERLAAATAFWSDPPQEMLASALGAIIKARSMRPQVARMLPTAERTRILAALLDPGETVAASLLVALHLAERRKLLGVFLDRLGLAHEDGVLKEADDAPEPTPITREAAQAGAAALRASFPEHQVEVYFNTLWLQDPDRWAALEHV